MDDNDVKTFCVTEKLIDGTLYIVESVIGSDATETAYDKVKRLILNNLQNLGIPKVS